MWDEASDDLPMEMKAEAERQFYVVLNRIGMRIKNGQPLSGSFFERDDKIQITGKDIDGVRFVMQFEWDGQQMACMYMDRHYEREMLDSVTTPWANGIEGEEAARMLEEVKIMIRDLAGLDLDKPIGHIEWVPSYSKRSAGVYNITFRPYYRDRLVSMSHAMATVANIGGPRIIGFGTFRWREIENIPAVPDEIISARKVKEMADEHLRKNKMFMNVRDFRPPQLIFVSVDPLDRNARKLWIWRIEYLYERRPGQDYPLDLNYDAVSGDLSHVGHFGRSTNE